jgi:hypothetical protein
MSGAKNCGNDDLSEMMPPSCTKCTQRSPIAVNMASTDLQECLPAGVVALSLYITQATLAIRETSGYHSA